MPPILLIHGFPFDSVQWNPQAAHLRAAGYTVLTPDLPGFGAAHASAPPRDHASISLYADYIHDLIRTECGGKAIVGGFSMGGYILFDLLRNHPEDVVAAMFIDTRPDADTADARAGRLKSIETLEKEGPAPVIEALIPKQLGKRPTEAHKQQARAHMQRQTVPAMIAAQTAMAKRRDSSDLLPDLSLPVLIIVGAEDGITPPSVSLNMQSHMPHAMVVQIVASGHLTPLEQPDAVNSAITAFLATLHK